MFDLTVRQKDLLKLIIEEYITTCVPVSSGELTTHFKLNISPATVRNEMATLIRAGFLDQPHVSAGRFPTPLGYRFYIQNLMDEVTLPVLKEVAIKQNVWNSRYEFDRLLKSAATALADATQLLAIVSTDDGRVFASGIVNILDHSEFFDIDVSRAVLNLVDNYQLLLDMYEKRNTSNICVILGEEFEREALFPVSIVVRSFHSGNKKGYVSLIGPARMRYKDVIPAIRYMVSVLEELGSDW
ncbi:hypothetical protein KA001_01450 [Patescibacteria group bacterium]|nr:hypothetical protein [Patescibacteria group bacterium]